MVPTRWPAVAGRDSLSPEWLTKLAVIGRPSPRVSMGRLQNDAACLTVHAPNPRLRRALAAALSFLAVDPFRSLHLQTRRGR